MRESRSNRPEVVGIRHWLMAAVPVVVVAAGFGTAAVYWYAGRIRTEGRREVPRPADVAIILGAYTDGYRPGQALMARLKAGLHLYRRGYVRYIIVSGGQGDDETVAESRSMKRFLILNGVSDDVIVEEHFSTDTLENLVNSQRLMERLRFKSAVIVTSDYHLPRALWVARQLSMNVSGYASVSRDSEFRFAVREVFAQAVYRWNGYRSRS